MFKSASDNELTSGRMPPTDKGKRKSSEFPLVDGKGRADGAET
jgi:hypothetical protein